MTAEAAIRTRGLTKTFGRRTVVDSLDLHVRAGDLYGFLGPNGSGKTTTLRMLLGLVLANSGEVEVLGEPMPRRARRVLPQVGVLVEGPAAHGNRSARANLALLDAAGPGGDRRTRRARVDDALAQVGLDGVGRQPVRSYSLGMRQRLGLAAALLRTPRLLVLDEPTNGLDPAGIREVRSLLLGLHRAGTTILLSSHLLAEVELLATRVGVLDAGRLVLEEEPALLCAPTSRTWVTTVDGDRLAGLLGSRLVRRDGDRALVEGADPARVNDELVQAGLRVSGLAAEVPTLEEVVLAVTGAGTDEHRRVSP